MSLGLKRGAVRLEEHRAAWEDVARDTVRMLKEVLGDAACDVQHVGSTSIKTIRAKPIIDIAVAVDDYWAVLRKREELEEKGVVLRLDERPEQLLFVMGDFSQEVRTHHIHVVLSGSDEWKNYLNFRDYLNACPDAAETYEKVKLALAERYALDRGLYTEGKSEVISKLLREAAEWRNNQ